MISVGRSKCTNDDLDLSTVLQCGQAFRWWFDPEESAWFGTIRECLWRLEQNASGITCHALGPPEEANLAIIEDYLQLNRSDIAPLYSRWSAEDPVFRQALLQHKGVRVLRQDPVETLFAFICSSNNNIARISQMLTRLCERYGTRVHVSERDGTRDFHTFPRVDALCGQQVECELRGLGFGYRAGFVQRTAEEVVARGGASWLQSLRCLDLAACRSALMRLPGVGAKVAACVGLMALDQTSAVPVDTHVLRLVRLHYSDGKVGGGGGKTVTAKEHDAINLLMIDRFGTMAGWAQAVLFCSQLSRLPGHPPQSSQVPANPARQKSKNTTKTNNASAKVAKEKVEKESRKRNKPRESSEVVVRKSSRRAR